MTCEAELHGSVTRMPSSILSDMGRQESEQRQVKLTFGLAYSALVFQEAQLIDMHSVPFIHLFYGDKSFSGQPRDHYPIYDNIDTNIQ